MPLPDDLFTTCEGFLSLPEAEKLYALACGVPAGSNVVEIGSYRARSTIALALGAKEAGAMVYAVDNHPDYEVDGVKFGMSDNQAYYANIAHYGVGDVVKTINLPSDAILTLVIYKIALLFIDGDHSYEQVKKDFFGWCRFADTIALHDTAGYHEGVTQLLNEVLEKGDWERIDTVDSLSILKRVIK